MKEDWNVYILDESNMKDDSEIYLEEWIEYMEYNLEVEDLEDEIEDFGFEILEVEGE